MTCELRKHVNLSIHFDGQLLSGRGKLNKDGRCKVTGGQVEEASTEVSDLLC